MRDKPMSSKYRRNIPSFFFLYFLFPVNDTRSVNLNLYHHNYYLVSYSTARQLFIIPFSYPSPSPRYVARLLFINVIILDYLSVQLLLFKPAANGRKFKAHLQSSWHCR